MAWIVDYDYDYWQNAEDTLLYRSAGKSYAHLPMRSNGLPYPLEQQIVDISKNPGRWLLRREYIEAVGSVMWLGERFWSLTGADKEQVVSRSWLKPSYATPSVVRIQAADRCFAAAEGESGALQDRLRALLFPVAKGAAAKRG